MVTAIANFLNAVSTPVIAAATVAMVCITIQANKRAAAANERAAELTEMMNWLTGALESHSTFQLRLAAKLNDIPVIWWDPTFEAVPHQQQHGKKDELTHVHLYVAKEFRHGEKKIERRKPPKPSKVDQDAPSP